jgi:hypothetical protein
MPTIAVFDQEKAELDSVLSSGILERAPNLAHLLAYVCSKYFDGAGEQVKEYNIAVEALGRPPDFDQKKDSIVRVEAHKLRKRLREYYQTEGADHPIRIEIPPGQYAPKFIFRHAPPQDDARTSEPAWSDLPHEAVLMQLARILKSPYFQPSDQCSLFLRHIVEHANANSECLEERTLGVEVFARNPDYDIKQDPIVRTTAGKVRKRLYRYYMDPTHEQELRITLPVDSYIPEARLPAVETTGAPSLLEPETLAVVRKAPSNSMRRRWLLGTASAGLLTLSVVIALALHKKSSLDLFWAPVTQQPSPVLIVMGQPIVYNLLSAQAQASLHGAGALQPSLESPADKALSRKDLVILPDRYVALGDAVCLVRLTALLEKYGKPYRIRGQRSTSFADLRENPAILIAAFNNEWTLHTAGQLRFTFVKDSAHDIDMVRDSQHPENTEWKLVGAWPYWDVANDYAIISRVRDTNSDRPVVIAAGITQYGTMATGEFLTTSEYLSEAISKLPDDWPKKNLQIVLRVPVVRGSPGRPRVLATQVW